MKSKNLVLATLIIFFITLDALIAIDSGVKLTQFREKRAVIYNSVFELQSQIGYVGLIHNFKDYLLRPSEDHYKASALRNYHSALLEVNRLEEIGQDYFNDLDMADTRAMLNAYKESLDRLPALFAQNLSSGEIDAALRFDDELSRQEIADVSTILLLEIESRAASTLVRSLSNGIFVLIALAITLVIFVRFYFQEQNKLLEDSQALNADVEANKNNLLRTQSTMLNVIDDMNHEKTRAEALNVQLTQRNQEMEQFVYSVSHDLKAPLVTISGMSNTLADELLGAITDKQIHQLKRIADNAKHMESKLEDLLELSRVSLKKIRKETVNVKSLIKKQCGALADRLNKTGSTIKLCEPIHSVYANETLLSQCLLNLLNNAIDYRDPDRPLLVEISCEKLGSQTVLAVKDNGVGIEERHHQKVFVIFERLAKGEGTGIGLTIVKTVMDKHQGEVSLTSEIGVGSCFYLSFPNEI